MLQLRERLPDISELVLYWTAGRATRCVLVSEKQRLNLQILCEGSILRRTAIADPRNARDIARQWQVEYDMKARPERQESAEPPCPACGDRASSAYAIHKGLEQRSCRTCGHDWSLPCPR
jgi:hypothetical protein